MWLVTGLCYVICLCDVSFTASRADDDLVLSCWQCCCVYSWKECCLHWEIMRLTDAMSQIMASSNKCQFDSLAVCQRTVLLHSVFWSVLLHVTKCFVPQW